MAKKFGSPTSRVSTGTVTQATSLTKKWSESAAAQLNTAEQVKNLLAKTLPVDYVMTDPDNPRKLALSKKQIHDIAQKYPLDKALLEVSDPTEWLEEYLQKVVTNEHLQGKAVGDLESLLIFAATLKSADRLIHPISVTKHDSTFQVIAGERRLLAHILLGEPTIAAIIKETPLPRTEVANLQWEENTQRLDMTLTERLDQVLKIVEAGEGLEKTSVTKLSKLLGISRADSQRYLVVLRYPSPSLMDAIRAGKINQLIKAAALAQLKPDELNKTLNDEKTSTKDKPLVKFQAKDKTRDFGVLLQAAAKQLKLSSLLKDADLDTPAGINKALDALLVALEANSNG